MALIEIEKKDRVYVVTLNNPENGNAINAESLENHRKILDELEAVEEEAAVIITSSDAKSWCVGMDLPWLLTQNEDQIAHTFTEMEEVFGRWALLPMPTVACITGHCMAGGAIVASVMDFRMMRADRGWFAFTEIDIKIPLSPILYELVDLLPNKQAIRSLLLTGRRIGGVEAKELGVVDEIHKMEDLPQKVMEFAIELSQKDRAVYASMKQLLKQKLASHYQ